MSLEMSASKIVLGTIVFLGLGASAPAGAQIPYFVSQYPSTYVPLTGASALSFSSPDDDSVEVAIGFNFEFYGIQYTHVNVGTNGGLTFAAACSTGNPCPGFAFCSAAGRCEDSLSTGSSGLPDPFQSGPKVAAFWDDLHTTGSFVYTRVLGAAPSRRFVAEWSSIRHYPASGTSRANFQIVLEEGSGVIRINYGTYLPGSDDSSWSGTIGIQNDATTALLGLPCASTSACGSSHLQSLQGQTIEFGAAVAAELVASGLSSTGGNPGDPLTVRVDARNLGQNATSAGFQVAVYFSTDSTITTADTLLGTLNYGVLAGRSVATATVTTTVPNVAPGFYSVGAIVDPANAIMEAVETNNISVFTSQFLVGSDLAVEIANVPDTGPGETENVQVTLLNNGAAQTSVPVRVYLSLDETFDSTDRWIGTATVSVPAQPRTDITVPVLIPQLLPNQYYGIAVIDPTNLVIEADETNNVGVTADTCDIAGADLAAENVAFEGEFAFRGGQLRVSGRLTNAGNATGGEFHYGFYLSNNPLINITTDPRLAEFGPITLAPGASLDISHEVTVRPDIPPDLYYLALVANVRSSVLDSRRQNDIARTQLRIEVRDPAPDFTVEDVRTPQVAASGESLVIERVLANLGNAAGAVGYDVYLSLDETLDPMADLRLGTANRTLAPGNEDRGVDTFLVAQDTPAGRYFVIYDLDASNTVAELFEDNNRAVSDTTVEVLGPELQILTTGLPLGTLNVRYEIQMAASGGVGAYQWRVAEGALPAGLMLTPSGRLSGVPTVEGRVQLVLAVSDGALEVSREYTLLITTATLPLEVLTRALAPAFVGRAYEYPLTALGGVPPYTWSYNSSGTLPGGLTFEEEGVFRGRPDAPGVANVTVTVTDGMGATAQQSLVLRVVSATDSVRFADDVLPDAQLGESFEHVFRAAPGTGASPFTFELAGGEVPPGLTLQTDRLFGVPTNVGVYSFSMRLRDTRGDFDLNQYVVRVEERDGVSFTTTGLPQAQVGKAYVETDDSAVQLRAVSLATPGQITFTLLEGALPAGLALSPEGVISGTPTAAGTSAFVLVAEDAAGQRDLRAFGIVVQAAPVAPEPVPYEDDGCGCTTNHSSGGGWGLGLLLGGVLLFRRRLWPLAALLLATQAQAQTQVGPYFVDVSAAPYMERTSGLNNLTFSSTDDSAVTVPLPFSFRYFSNDYSQLLVSTNGYITFGSTGTSYTNNAMPNSGTPNDMIAGFWDDMSCTSVDWIVEGTAPNRVAIIQYSVLQRLGDPSGGSLKIQFWLYEGPGGRFEVRYGTPQNMTNPGTFTASMGFEDATGTVGAQFGTCGGNCTGTDLNAMANMVVRAQQDSGPDIIPTQVVPPAEVYLGVVTPVEVRFRSLHQQSIGPFSYALHLLSGIEQPGPGNLIGGGGPVTLPPYTESTFTGTVVVPLNVSPSGRYRLALVADPTNQLMEPSETNNQVVSVNEFRIANPQPDFVVADVVANPAVVAPGGNTSVSLFLRNQGNLDGAAAWRLVLSRNRVISVDDLELDTGMVSLPALRTATVTVSVAAPQIEPGTYYLGAVIDPANVVAEISEINNNGAGRTPLRIQVGTVSVASTTLPGAYLGVDYSFFLQGQGGDGRYTWAVSSGNLPAGLSLRPNGELWGVPTRVGASNFEVTVTSASTMATASLTLDVREPDGGLTIVTRQLLPGVVGEAYPPAVAGTPVELRQRIVVVGAEGAVTFTALTTPPPGLELTAAGSLEGLPRQRGVYTLGVSATDGVTTATREFTLTIAEPGRLTLVAQDLPQGRLSEDYNQQLRVLGKSRTATVSFSTGGPMPPGLSLTPDGRIMGLPQRVGEWQFLVTASEGVTAGSAQDSASFRIEVLSSGTFTISPATIPEATVGEPYEVELTARMGTPPYAWRLIAGEGLPRGLRYEIVEQAGVQSWFFRGTPEAAGVVSFLVTAQDAAGQLAQVPLTLVVKTPAAPPVVTQPDEGCSCSNHRSNPGALWGLLLVVWGMGRTRRLRGRMG